MNGYTFEKFIEETNAAKTSAEVFKVFESALAQIGYDRICYSLVTDHPSVGLKAGHGILRNYSESWMKHYAENGYQELDPVPKYGVTRNSPFSWEWLIKNIPLNANEMRVMNEAQEERLLDGLAVPVPGMGGEMAGVGLASSLGGVALNQNLISLIRAMTQQFHIAYLDRETAGKENWIRNIILTKREREILLWAAEGKSDQVIADILGISHATVRFHMNNIFKKLNANERILAVVKAIRYGLILPDFVRDKPT